MSISRASAGSLFSVCPPATQITLEISVFALDAALIGRLGAVPLAAHQIALNSVAFTYMCRWHSSAAAVARRPSPRRKEPRAAADAGDTAILAARHS